MKKNRPILSQEKLIEAIICKEKIGAEALYYMYAKSLYGVIVKIITNTELAEDVLQETFIKIWTGIDRYETDKGRLFTWMVTIARNVSINMLRAKNYKQCLRTLSIEFEQEKVEYENPVSLNTDTIGIKRFVQSLKEDQRQIFDLIYYKGYKQAEVAEILDIPLGTVKTRWRMGILTLRGIYRDYTPQLGTALTESSSFSREK